MIIKVISQIYSHFDIHHSRQDVLFRSAGVESELNFSCFIKTPPSRNVYKEEIYFKMVSRQIRQGAKEDKKIKVKNISKHQV